MKRKMLKWQAYVLALLLSLCSLPSLTVFAEKENDAIEIKTVADLSALAASCKADSWSKDKKVVLMNDLDLKGTDFTGIPVFAGVFDGKGHKITGFNMNDAGTVYGLFRYVLQGAEVKNLTVEGVIKTEKESACVGGIAGVNRGTIISCAFNGSVAGKHSVAGIVGENTKTGLIISCSASGTINAPYEVGGIVGTNHGIIRDCTNKAVINNDTAFIEEMDEESISWLLGSISTDANIRITAGTDVGGIAGYSDGSIFTCVNFATVGYEHTGYNVGGIVGRQGGMVSACVNHGNVLGRKDVGGIVGQMEPFVSVDEAASISDAVSELHDLIDKLLDDLSATEKGVSKDLEDVRKHTDTALDLGKDISKELIDFTNSNIDSMNMLADEVSYVLEKLPDIIDSLELSGDAARRFGDDLKKINDDLDILDKLDKNAYSETKHGRLTVTSAVGGYVTADNLSPEKDIRVKLTVHEGQGYKLSKIVVYDANGKNVQLIDNGDGTYEFDMPEENVVVRSAYSYVGDFYVQSNAGGSVTKAYSESAGLLKITVKPNGGYTFDKVSVGDKEIAISEFNYDEKQNSYTCEIQEKVPEGPVYITAEFRQEASSHKVTVASSTGGVVTVDKALCSCDETVTIKVTEAANYRLSGLLLIANGVSNDLIAMRPAEDALANPNEYTFSMPDCDAKIEAVFSYSDDSKNSEDTVIYTESAVGGSMYFVKNPTTNDYIIYIMPEAGYEVNESAAITLYSGAKAGAETDNPVGSLSTEQLTQYGAGYSYTLNTNLFEEPVRAYGAFKKAEETNTINVTSGTGGVATVDTVAAKEKDKVSLAVVANNGYRVEKIIISCEGKDIPYTLKEDTKNVYEFEMPDGDVDIKVSFAPIMFIVTSNWGGTVSVVANGDTLKFTVNPDDGYTLAEAPKVVDAKGLEIALVKRTAGVFAYEFDLTGKEAPIYAEVDFTGATDYEVVENSKDNINEKSKNLTNSMNDIKKTVEEITDLVTDDYGEIVDAETFLQDTDKVNELIKLIIRLAREMSEAGEAASAMVSSLNTLANVLTPYLTDGARDVQEDARKAIDDLDDCINYLQEAGSQTKTVIDYLNSQPSIKFTDLSSDFSDNISSLFDEMKNISDGMSKVNTHLSDYTDIIIDDLRAVNDKANDILELIIDIVNNVENAYKNNDGIFEDVSDEELESVTDGKVASCINNGAVSADLNVGGIAGAMSVDTEDPEDNAAGSVDWNMRNTYVTKCVLSSCTNNGKITGKTSGVGAVAGFQGIGVITECMAYGSAESDEGQYVGGIAGHSKAIIRSCDALCMLSGSRYVGGIAGLGNQLANNHAIVHIKDGSDMVGAIAGQVKLTEDDHGINVEKVCGNKYVSAQLGGIDGISYADAAEGVSYEELLTEFGISAAYRHLTITYVADGRILEKEEIKYGEKLNDVKLPEIPEIEGFYGVWPDVAGMIMESNLVLEALYYPDITTIKSEEALPVKDKNGAEIKKNVCLIDGVFDGGARLNVTIDSESFPEDLRAGGEVRVYNVTLTGADETKDAKIRLLNTFGKAVKMYEKQGNQWKEVESVDYGTYEQVALHDGAGVFAMVAYKKSYTRYIYAGAAAGAVILVIVIINVSVKAAGKRKERKKAVEK